MRLLGYLNEKRLASKIAQANQKVGGWGGQDRACPSRETGCGGRRPQVCVGETALCQSEEGEPRDGRNQTIVSGGCLLSLSVCRRGFQIRPSSLFMLCGYNSSLMASLMNWSMHLVLAERSFVSCSLIIWSLLMLCSTTADLSVCAGRVCLLC